VQNNEKAMEERRNGEGTNSCPLLINSTTRSPTVAALEILSCRGDLVRVSSKNRGTPKNFQL